MTGRKAPYGATCVVCRTGIRRGSPYVTYGGFWRHPKCTPTPKG